MLFTSEVALAAFLKDVAFYENDDCYCLGNSLLEAGEVVSKIAPSKNECERVNDYVGMVDDAGKKNINGVKN